MTGQPTAAVPEQAITAAEAHVLHRITLWRNAAGPPDTLKLDELTLTARRTLIADALEAAAPAIREAERRRLFGDGDPGQYHGLIKLTRADAAIAERDRWRAVLAYHYLAGIECDPERKLDNPVCGCSLVFLGWHPSIGEARQAWIDHVAGLIGDPVCPDCNYPLHRCAKCRELIGHDGYDDHRCRVAELEQLARDILATFHATGDGHRARVGQVQIARWETTLKGNAP